MEKKQRNYIYQITNTLDGTVYIGVSIHPNKRWIEHKNTGRRGNYKIPLYNAINKYGEQSFTFDVIASCISLDEFNFLAAESDKIIEMKRSGVRLYNLRNGMIGHGTTSDETRARMSASQTGRKFTTEWCRRISVSLTGKKLSDEHREKIRLNNGRRKLTDEFIISLMMEFEQLNLKVRDQRPFFRRIAFENNVSVETIKSICRGTYNRESVRNVIMSRTA